MLFPANPGWGLLLVFAGWSLPDPGGGPCGCSSPAILVGACCWLWWGGPSPILAEGPGVQFPANPGWGLLLALKQQSM